MNFWTIIGTVLGALIAGLSMFLNSIYSSKSTQKREDRKRLIEEINRDIKELESLYERTLHKFDKLIRELGSLPSSELEDYYKIEIRLKLISTNSIINKVKELRQEIAEMSNSLTEMPEEFIPNFEDDRDRKYRLKLRKDAESKRKEEASEFTPKLRNTYKELSELMKEDLQKRRLLNIDDYLKYRKEN